MMPSKTEASVSKKEEIEETQLPFSNHMRNKARYHLNDSSKPCFMLANKHATINLDQVFSARFVNVDTTKSQEVSIFDSKLSKDDHSQNHS